MTGAVYTSFSSDGIAKPIGRCLDHSLRTAQHLGKWHSRTIDNGDQVRLSSDATLISDAPTSPTALRKPSVYISESAWSRPRPHIRPITTLRLQPAIVHLSPGLSTNGSRSLAAVCLASLSPHTRQQPLPDLVRTLYPMALECRIAWPTTAYPEHESQMKLESASWFECASHPMWDQSS